MEKKIIAKCEFQAYNKITSQNFTLKPINEIDSLLNDNQYDL